MFEENAMSTAMENITTEDQPTTVDVDPEGDIRLIVEYEDAKTKHTETREFLVSTQVMCLASTVWRTMFSPTSRWVKGDLDRDSFQLFGDDPDALIILLDIAHLNFDRVPSNVSFHILLRLAVLCDKYDTVKLVRRYITEWITCVKALKPLLDPQSEEWLFIAWVFGEKSIYEQVSKDLVLVTSVSSKFLEEPVYIYRGVKILEETLPPGAIDAIVKARQKTIEALLKLCRKLVDTYTPGFFPKRLCQGSENLYDESWSRSIFHQDSISSSTQATASTPTLNIFSQPSPPRAIPTVFSFGTVTPRYAQQCDALVLGSVIVGLSGANLWPVPSDSTMVDCSVSILGEKLLRIPCHKKLDDGSRASSHERCMFTTPFRTDVQRILNGMESGVLESHSLHLTEQHRKLNSFLPRMGKSP